MNLKIAIRYVCLLAVGICISCAADITSWTNYSSAPEEDGRLRLRAVWKSSSPAHDILDEGGATRPANVNGTTYEFCVLVENIGEGEMEIPSWSKPGVSKIGISIGGEIVVPYIISPSSAFGRINFVESPNTYRPVKLKPGEAVRLPVYYRIVKEGESLPPHHFYFAVEESIAKRYGWWSGALACKGEEFHPDEEHKPTKTRK